MRIRTLTKRLIMRPMIRITRRISITRPTTITALTGTWRRRSVSDTTAAVGVMEVGITVTQITVATDLSAVETSEAMPAISAAATGAASA